MKHLLFGFLFLLIGCKNFIKNEDNSLDKQRDKIEFTKPKANTNLTVNSKEDLLGYWVGNQDYKFIVMDSLYDNKEDVERIYCNKITISFDELNGEQVKGHSILSGSFVPFEGKIKKVNNTFVLELTEIARESKVILGSFKWIAKIGDSIINGKWVTNAKGIKIKSKTFELNKKIFKYNKNNELDSPFINNDKSKKMVYNDTIDIKDEEFSDYSEYSYFATTEDLFNKNSSKELLKKEFVSNLTKGDIYILRNSIFARHGFVFADRNLRNYFDEYDWYLPVFNDVKDELTEIEKKNIDLLLRYEQNATEYYDTFGR